MPIYLQIIVFVLLSSTPLFYPDITWAKEADRSRETVLHKQFPSQVSKLSHPRLLITEEKIPQLQSQAETTHKEIWDAILQFTVEDGVDAPSRAPTDGGLSDYRNFGNQLVPVSFACVVTEQNRICDTAKELLLKYASWSQWGNEQERDLALAHMMIGNAFAYDWLFNRLTVQEQARVRLVLSEWADKMYEASSGGKVDDWNNWWRKSYAQNHHWTNNAALGMVALALLDEEPRAEIWLAQAVEQLQKTQTLLNGIEDGSWHEGIHYQDYGLTMIIPFWLSVRDITGVNLIPEEYMKNYVNWRLYNFLPGEWLPILQFGDVEADWESGFRSYSALRFAAREFEDGSAEWLVQQMQETVGRPVSVWTASWYVFEYLYYEPNVKSVYPLLANKSKTFPDIQSVIWRTGWREKDVVFGLKADGYAGQYLFNSFTESQDLWEAPCADSGCELNFGHDHDDSLSFYLYYGGVRVIPEVIGNLARDTSLHNTLLIDGVGQYRPPDNRYRYPEELVKRNGTLLSSVSTARFDYLVADATERYSHVAGMRDVSRTVLFVRPNYFVMVDNLAANQPHQYQWISHFVNEVAVEDNWLYSESESGVKVGVQVVGSETDITTISDTEMPYAEVSTQKAVESTRFIHLLVPSSSQEWQERPRATLIDDSGAAIVVHIQNNNNHSYTDQLVVRYDDSVGYVNAAGFATNADVVLIRRDSTGTLRHLFTYGGSFLQDVDAEGLLVENLDADTAFEAEFIGSIVRISSAVDSDIRLYAPDAKYLYVNGVRHAFERSGDYIQPAP